MQYILRMTLLLCISLSFSGCALTDKVQEVWRELNVSVTPRVQQHTVIVPGYGAPVAGNTTYEKYIQQVAHFVTNADNAVDAVVFTGSYSSLKDTSEATSMKKYFDEIADTNALNSRGVDIYTEQCAIVSWQNITYTKSLLTEEGIAPTRVTLFGDMNREDKLKAFASVAFNTDISIPDSAKELVVQGVNYTSIDWRGFSFGADERSEQERKAIFIAEIAGAYDAELGNSILRTRINAWTTTFGYDVADNLVEKGCKQYAGFQ